MTDFSSEFFSKSDPGLISKFEEMLKSGSSYFFDVDEVEALADHYLDNGSPLKARKAVMHGKSLFGQNNALLLKQAQALMMEKKPARALDILNFLEASEPGNTDLLLFKAGVHRNLNDHKGSQDCLIKALESSTENREDIYLDLAFEQEMIDDYAGAIESLRESLRINPDHEASLFELGFCFDMANDLENGVDFFNAFLQEQPYSFIGWYNLALCYEKLGLFEKGIESIDYCLAIKEDFINGHILRGNMYESCELEVQAIEAYTESLLHDEDNPMTYALIGECFERLGEWQAAESNYMQALKLDTSHVVALMGMGAVKEHENKYAVALKFYREALNRDENDMDNWHVYAEALRKAERYELCEEAYIRMLELFHVNEEILINLSEVQTITKGYDAAIETATTYLPKLEDRQDIGLHLAKYHIEWGRVAAGTEMLSVILEKNPKKHKYFLKIFPESVQIPNIAHLIDLHTQAQREDEL
jgi:tetratricopeptide (TPR) repeat protein